MADTLQSPPHRHRRWHGSRRRLRRSASAFLTDRRLACLFISPALALLLFLSIWPLIRLIWLSFTDYSVTRDVPASFIGFDNYVDVLTSPVVHKRALTTLIFVVGAVGLQTLLGFAIAFLISRRIRGRGALTTLFLIPMMLSPVVVGLFWKFMLDVQFGVVNSFLGQPRARPRRVADPAAAGAALADHRRHLAVDAVHHADRARGPDGGAEVPLRGGRDRPRLGVVQVPPDHASRSSGRCC